MTDKKIIDAEIESAPESTAIVPTTPLGLIQQAIDKGIDVDKLGRLMDLQERWEKDQARKAYFAAMSLCQQKMPVIIKNQMNTHTKSAFANLEMVTKTIRPIYTENGFSISYTSTESKLPGCIRMVALCQHVEGHTEKFEMDIPIDGTGAKGGASGMNAVQGHGSSVSYARRYLDCMIFNLAIAAEDTDGNPQNQRLNEEQCDFIRSKFAAIEAAGISFSQQKFIDFFAAQDRLPDAHVLDELVQKSYTRMIKMLDAKLYPKAGAK